MQRTLSNSLAVLAMSAAGLVANDAYADFAPSAAAAVPLQVGVQAPDFTAVRADGTPYTFAAAHLGHPVVLIFYRGGWCPYCNGQLADLRKVEPDLQAKGFEVVFVSTDRPELLYSSLKTQDIHYTLLSDGGLRAAQAYHVAFHLSDAEYAEELKWGVDLEKTTGGREHALPVPSVFIIDKAGVIRFVYSNPDFRVRLGADTLWKAALPLATSTPPT
jgi:peroxiredoxin